MSKTKINVSDIPEDIRAEYEKKAEAIVEAAKTEAENIIALARKQAVTLGKEDESRVPVKSVRSGSRQGDEEVTYTFFKDNGEYSDDVFISVNCEKIVCQRGVPVRIKRKFVWAYEQAMRQQEKAAEKILEQEKRYEARARETSF